MFANPKLSDTLYIHILMGLPGSGKSYWASSHKSYEIIVRNLDEYKDLSKYKAPTNYFYTHARCNNVCFDGLILTKEQLTLMISKILNGYTLESFGATKYKKIQFVIHHWNEDRDACLINDRHRVRDHFRSQPSEISIKNLPFDNNIAQRDIDEILKPENTPEVEHFLGYFEVELSGSVEYHTVVKLEPIDQTLSPYLSFDKDSGKAVLCSHSWSNGGSWANCYGDSGPIEPEEPVEFTEFDDFLAELCPDLSFRLYKQLYNACVTIRSKSESNDYYGGTVTMQWYECDIEKLKTMLADADLID